MADPRVHPHILIDALPSFTKMLVGDAEPPIVLTPNLLPSWFSQRPELPLWRPVDQGGVVGVGTKDDDPDDDDPDENGLSVGEDDSDDDVRIDPDEALPRVIPFFPTHLILEQRSRAAIVIDAADRLKDALAVARDLFAIPARRPVRIACAGSHGSLWEQERAKVRRLGSLMTPASIKYLKEAANKRRFICDLYAALQTMEGVKLEWLVEGYPDLREQLRSFAEPALPDDLAELARLARRDLVEKPRLAALQATVPLIYHETDRGWQLYWDNSRGPSRETGRLLEQFAGSFTHERHRRAVLVKLVPGDRARHNPCDNPVITPNQLDAAARSGIDAILLDRKYGVLVRDLDSEAEQEKLGPPAVPPPDLYAA